MKKNAWWKNNKGVAAVETALALPILLVAVLGLFEFSRAFWIQGTVANAVSIAGRHLSLNPTADQNTLQTIARANVSGLTSTGLTVTLGSSFVQNAVTYKTLSSSYVFNPTSGMVPGLSPITFTRQVTVPVE